ncbi:hypothetical protein DFP72DRAFT_1079352 [Ephemerocybe angulata]|uniref:Uncharacterized protein n=1 Tax=Ephemerocybe angulata TaxID=980116 RepID=A0A8H6HD39_9AGAR|nr:hypothetical protein DFP72DRAFT_1079352 [Tulosesus angulatus]
MIHIQKNHGLRVTFARALRDAIFLPDAEDKRKLESVLARQTPPLTYDEGLRRNPQMIKRHVKHVVPPPEQLFTLVSKLFEVYGPLKDAQTGQPLFSPSAWKSAKSVLEYIKLGYISDPPNIALYYPLGIDKKTRLTIYRCWRANRLKDYTFRHNMRTGTYNTTGQHYLGHFDIHLINKCQELLNSSRIHAAVPSSTPVGNWVNGNLYVRTTEVFGILPVPDDVRLVSGLLSYDDEAPPKIQQYLAKRQGTKYAVITVHTDPERKLYSSLMQTDPSFTREGGPDWAKGTRRWNEGYANGVDIFYKSI